MNQFNTNQITLKYMKNPRFTQNKEILEESEVPNKEDIKFYKNRIYTLFKQLMKNRDFPNENIKIAHNNYLSLIISHFKQIDTVELLQEEFKNLPLQTIFEENEEDEKDFNITELDDLFSVNRKETIGNLNNYVIKTSKNIKNEKTPKIKKLNIKCDKFKSKGLI